MVLRAVTARRTRAGLRPLGPIRHGTAGTLCYDAAGDPGGELVGTPGTA